MLRGNGPCRMLAGRGPREPAPWLNAQWPLRLYCARSFCARLLGLWLWVDWGTRPAGLLLPDCRAVHTWGLRQPVDLVFLDAAGHVVRVLPRVPPGRCVFCLRASAVLELPAGYCARPDGQAQVEAAWRTRKIVV
ncbi:MAG: DUF192 domain-containing protein [Castellaniella sp.]|uniref:DUF192 domain-containing protein n=1 Tax=Castellaniella sp. TaxID=1955812 RepID=UPI003A83E3C4